MESIINLFSRNKHHLTSVCGLLLAGLLWARHLPQTMDVLLGDEAEYLHKGLDLFSVVHKDWGPTYNLWYKFLSLFTDKPVPLYYFNYILGALALPILLYSFLVQRKMHIIIAFIIAYCFQFSEYNIVTWPRVAHFVVLALLLFFIVTYSIKSKTKKLFLFASLCFFLAYARPEIMSVGILVALVALIFFIRDKPNLQSNLPYLLLAAFIFFTLKLVYGSPPDTYLGIDRTYIAFCQHYAVAMNIRLKMGVNPIIEWIDMTRPYFGDCKNLKEILTTKMPYCLPHFAFTIKLYLFSMIQYVVSLFFPFVLLPKMKLLLLLFGAFVGMLIFMLAYKPWRQTFFELLKPLSFELMLMIVISVPSMGASVIIFPRQHYMLTQLLWMSLLIALVFQTVISKIVVPKVLLGILLVLGIMVAPHPQKYIKVQVRDSKDLCVQKFIAYMDAHRDGKKHVILSNILNVHMLFMHPEDYEQLNTEYTLKRMPVSTTFSDLMLKKPFDMIIINDALIKEPRFRQDTLWQNLIKDPDRYTFKRVQFSDSCDSYLLIKK